MKCATKSCQRNKNILSNGFCNSCNDARNLDNPRPKQNKTLNRIEINVNEMEGIYGKLKKGEAVDQNVVNGILIGGFLNFIAQQDATEKLESKVIELEADLKTSKCRIESLENWMNTNNEALKSIKNDLKQCSIDNIELSKKIETSSAHNEDVPKSFEKKCSVCGEVFTTNSDFENHMIEKHEAEKTFKCDVCGKMFILEWRLKKHGIIHTEKTKKCHYFLNKKPCPFNNIGCKFAHDDEVIEEPNENETTEDAYTANKNQCHLCSIQLSSRDELMEHVETNHEEYFQGVMEVAAASRT